MLDLIPIRIRVIARAAPKTPRRVTSPPSRYGQLRSPVLAAVLAAGLLALPVGASADTGGTVTATVTPGAACATLSGTTTSFGTLPFSRPSLPSTGQATPNQFITSCAGFIQNLFVHGSDATATGVDWTLADVPDTCLPAGTTNEFVYNLKTFNPQGTGPFPGVPGTYPQVSHNLVAADQSFTNVPPATPPASIGQIGEVSTITMPCTGSSGAGVQLSISVVFTVTA